MGTCWLKFGGRISLWVALSLIVLTSAGTRCSKVGGALPATGTERTETKGTNVMTDENKTAEPVENDVEFDSSIELGKEKLSVKFELKNKSKVDIYVLDIFPIYDMETMKPSVDLNNTVVVWDEADGVRLIRGLPPYPKEKSMMTFYTPYSSKIEPGGTLKRHLDLPLPLLEFNPYYSPLEREKYEPVTITKTKLYVYFLKSSVEGFEAKEVGFAKSVFFVKSKFLLRDIQKVYNEQTVGPVKVLTYPETFTRGV